MPDLDQMTLKALLRYEPETGKLFWRERTPEMFKGGKHSTWNARFAGKEAGTFDRLGYRSVRAFGKFYKAHRIVWKIVHGEWPDTIDHIDGNPSNNRIENLRSVSQSENCKNSRMRTDNTSGVRGVHWDKQYQKWCAEIWLKGKKKFLGYFDDKSQAIAARKSAEKKHGFHPNHGRVA